VRADGGKAGAWDIAFLANEPVRAAEIDFSPAYLEIETSYLVPAGSPIRTIEDVDRPGVRIACADRAAYDLYLAAAETRAARARKGSTAHQLWPGKADAPPARRGSGRRREIRRACSKAASRRSSSDRCGRARRRGAVIATSPPKARRPLFALVIEQNGCAAFRRALMHAPSAPARRRDPGADRCAPAGAVATVRTSPSGSAHPAG
jgi:hypothetical protein